MRMPQGLEISAEAQAHAEEVVNQAVEELGCTREEAERMFWCLVYEQVAETIGSHLMDTLTDAGGR